MEGSGAEPLCPCSIRWVLKKARTWTDGVMEIGGRGGWPCARLWNGVGRSQRGAAGGSEEDNPQAEMKAAAVGVRVWHCTGLLLLGSGYQQRSGSAEGWLKSGADRLDPSFGQRPRGCSGTSDEGGGACRCAEPWTEAGLAWCGVVRAMRVAGREGRIWLLDMLVCVALEELLN